VDLIITDIAVFSVTPDGLVLDEVMPGSSLDEVRSRTEASFQISDRGARVFP
jgi:acyl CoA:acetate/3-ketoacid CoA transferase beta subunit